MSERQRRNSKQAQGLVNGSPARPSLQWSVDDDNNPWRDEIVRTIFGDVGTIISDFSCAIERHILLHGRMYVTNRFICFYSNCKFLDAR
jgi:hypothetical protein